MSVPKHSRLCSLSLSALVLPGMSLQPQAVTPGPFVLATICCTDVSRKTWLWKSSATRKQLQLPARCLWLPLSKPSATHCASSPHSSLSRPGTHKTRGVVVPYGFGIAKSFHGWVSLDDLILEGALEKKTKGCSGPTQPEGICDQEHGAAPGAPCCTPWLCVGPAAPQASPCLPRPCSSV